MITSSIEVDTTVEVDIDMVEAYNGLPDDKKAGFLSLINRPAQAPGVVSEVYEAYRSGDKTRLDTALDKMFYEVLGRIA